MLIVTPLVAPLPAPYQRLLRRQFRMRYLSAHRRRKPNGPRSSPARFFRPLYRPPKSLRGSRGGAPRQPMQPGLVRNRCRSRHLCPRHRQGTHIWTRRHTSAAFGMTIAAGRLVKSSATRTIGQRELGPRFLMGRWWRREEWLRICSSLWRR